MQKNEAENGQYMQGVLFDSPEEEQIINITEVALFYYFKPEDNANFPNERYKSYKQYFSLDYNWLIIGLDTEFES